MGSTTRMDPVRCIGWRWAFLGQVPLCLSAFIVFIFRNKILVTGKTSFDASIFSEHSFSWYRRITPSRSRQRKQQRMERQATMLVNNLIHPLWACQKYVASEPFTLGHLFGCSLFATYLCNYFSFTGSLAALFHVPLYSQAVGRLSATQAGLRLIPAIACGVFWKPLRKNVHEQDRRYY